MQDDAHYYFNFPLIRAFFVLLLVFVFSCVLFVCICVLYLFGVSSLADFMLYVLYSFLFSFLVSVLMCACTIGQPQRTTCSLLLSCFVAFCLFVWYGFSGVLYRRLCLFSFLVLLLCSMW